MKQWVDPPSGWRWGFPKVWDPQAHPDIAQWFVEQGLPETELEFAINCIVTGKQIGRAHV